eukprot:TRINITY_DN86328_c0_g1_i1.p1 TRINITY_DN86328_c0_g1~~TRINITY_DN86328_c0_g1_i1.p1  ORF type:complete len:157 (+),score=42.08 TRINITY_DN86328_c0_g1_i1:85-555(+)
MSDGKKLTQAELLQLLSPPPFNQSKAVPADAVVEATPDLRWWRTDSPRGSGDPDGQFPDLPAQHPSIALSATRGVLGDGKRSGPGNFFTSNQTGSGTAAHFSETCDSKTISGFSGHIPGKVAGNCVGGTYDSANKEATEHLKTTSQAKRFDGMLRA